MKLKDTIKSSAVAIAGTCKNAGKTTALNALIEDMSDVFTLALTSIGRDGETTDVATVTPKPDVYVREGTLFATASGILKYCDTTLEILETCGIYTPLGEVVCARAKSDGNIQIAGPSTVEGLRTVHGILKSFGAQRTIFDGAISRKSLSVPTLCEEFILCTGASYSPSMAQTITDTAYFVRLFTSEIDMRAPAEEGSRYTVYKGAEMLMQNDIGELVTCMKKLRCADFIRMRGAVTDSVMKPLTECGLRDTVIVADDPSKLLFDKKYYEKCTARGVAVRVEKRSDLCAVTVNPYSVYGAEYDKKAFIDGMRDALSEFSVPVFDVKE